jgi:hypothetical protein
MPHPDESGNTYAHWKPAVDRGREFLSVPPPSEPDVRISRIRLSGWWYYLLED